MGNLIRIELKHASAKTGIPENELDKLIVQEFKDGKLPLFMKMDNIPFAVKLIQEITEELKDELGQSRADLQKRVNDTFRIILYNLVQSTLTRHRLSLPGSNSAYTRGSHFCNLFFTRNSVKVTLNALKKYLICKPGNTYQHIVDSYEPNKLFQLKLIPLLYHVYEEYNEDSALVIIQDKQNKDFETRIYTKKDLSTQHTMRRTSSVKLERTYREDLEQLIKINEVLKHSTFALKAPVQRVYSRGQVMMGGRLYVPLQRLPDRRARIRINTFFNGNPVAEVDLKANHSAMLYALNGKQLPRDFYQIVANDSKQTKEKVKWVVMKMIGAKDRAIDLFTKKATGSSYQDQPMMSQGDRKAIEESVQRLFPELYDAFYKDMGVVLQSMEGDILLDAMCSLVDKGIASLPIHDALYVEQQYVAEAEKVLKESWKKNLDVDFEPFVDIDYP